MPAGAQFHEGISAGWSDGYEKGGFKRRMASFRGVLDRNVEAGQLWLDLGCGSGVLTKELLVRGASVIGVDGSPGMLEQARTLVGDTADPPSWIQSDVQSVPELPDNSIDGVLCSSVIEYVDSPKALLEEVFRLLRPDGRFVVSIPTRFSTVRTIQKLIRKGAQLIGRERFPYLAVSRFEMRSNSLRRWLGNSGFTVERVTPFDPILPTATLRVLRPALMIVECRKTKTS